MTGFRAFLEDVRKQAVSCAWLVAGLMLMALVHWAIDPTFTSVKLPTTVRGGITFVVGMFALSVVLWVVLMVVLTVLLTFQHSGSMIVQVFKDKWRKGEGQPKDTGNRSLK